MSMLNILSIVALIGSSTLLCGPKSVLGAKISECDEFISHLAEFDVHLSHRKEFAIDLVKKPVTAQTFVDSMNDLKDGGKNYACGLTRYWIDNLFLGSPRLFEELRRSGSGYGIDAGFYDAIEGNKVLDMFTSYADLKDNYVLYRFQTSDVVDHVWIVIQRPGPEYKIFQSYNMAYSSHAWGSKSDLINKLWDQGHIRYWTDVLNMVKMFVEGAGGSIKPDNSIVYPPNLIEPAKNWIYYVVNYNKTLIVENFQKAYDKFGQNKWLAKDFFVKEYITPLQKTMQTIKSYLGTNKTWTEEVHQTWIGLFGSPVPTMYPGIPFNFIPEFTANKKMELQVRVEIVDKMTNKCYENYKLIGRHVPGWTDRHNDSIRTVPAFSLFSSLLLFFSLKVIL